MIRNRGSELGMSLATALSVNALGDIDKVEALAMFRLDYQKTDKKLYIYIYFPSNLSKIRDLIDNYHAAKKNLSYLDSDYFKSEYNDSEIEKIKSNYIGIPKKYAYDHTRYEVSKSDKVAFSEVTNQEEVERTGGLPTTEG